MAGHDDDMFDFFSQSQAHHEAASVDADEYGFSQASSGHGGSGAGYHFPGRGSAGLDLNSQVEDFPDFGSYQQILQEDGGGIPPLFHATRSNVAPSRRPVPGSRGGRRGGRSRGRGRGRDGTIGAAAGNRMRGFVPMVRVLWVVGAPCPTVRVSSAVGAPCPTVRVSSAVGAPCHTVLRGMGASVEEDGMLGRPLPQPQLPKRRTTTLRTMMKTTTMVSTR
uniref:Uncharacterized protein n=1 Tax=Oryza rufipogon TaxID=4529 RepID=A0A0E0NU90_ORYRU